jgi:Cu(I)/Ag(I) efflux system membrane protein CusA/SilA
VIARLIAASLGHRAVVLLLALALTAGGLYALAKTPLDAIPDLSDVQVIVRTPFPGQAPRVVEDQVTYPLASALLSVPGATTVRGYSFFGDSFVYVLFADGTDPYWARSRVLEYLSQAAARLPEGVRPALGPDASGVGWVYQYALVDRTGRHDLGELRSLQDWYLKPQLQSVEGVAEVATVGGMVRAWQVVVDPARLAAHGLTLDMVEAALRKGSGETGGSVLDLAETEYMVRTRGYVTSADDLRSIPLKVEGRVPVLLGAVADVRRGPEMRRGIAELDGEGEVTGGIVVMRHGANALATIHAARARLAELARGLPPGVEIVTTYDRSGLIRRAVDTLRDRLVEEFVVVALVCAVFLMHFRSSLVIVVSLPLGILASFLVMLFQGVEANLMSLGGIAIAIGAMVDASIVMVENVHRHLEREAGHGGARDRTALIAESCTEVGPALFFSLLIVALSFVPVFALGAQEGRLFHPLAFTKTYAMLSAAVLSVTLAPVLIWYLVRGRVRPERENPVNRAAQGLYRPVLALALRHPRAVLVAALLTVLATLVPAARLGTEFMPALDEGDLLYMPTAQPGISADAARALLATTDRLIRQVPEVERVFGKAGRAETATDPAPFEMLETTIKLKPRSEWRPGMTPERLRAELDASVRVPGIANAWVPPIKTRLDMLATGIKTPLGIKISGPELATIERLGAAVERELRAVPGTFGVYAERAATGRYVDVAIRRADAARYGLNVGDLDALIQTAVGGMTVAVTVEGLERYPVTLRYPADLRDSLERLKSLPVVAPTGATVRLADLADVAVVDGPAMIRSENARPSGWVYVDIEGRDLGSVVAEARRRVAERVTLPPGYTIAWSGQYEYWERAVERLRIVVPATVLVIVALLYLNFRRLADVVLVLGTLPFALVGGLWLLWALGYHMSVAVAVGFIALAGVAAETGVVMLLYLEHAWRDRLARGEVTVTALREAIVEGALLRLRPKLMTVVTIMAGLLPIMVGRGTGSEVMRRIAAPMVGGMVSATLLTLLVIPSAFLLWHGRHRRP